MGEVAGPYLFPPDKFPITLRAYRDDNGAQVWEQTLTIDNVRDGLAAVNVPALAEREGVPVYVELEYGDGTVVTRAEGRLPSDG